jgi:hypothetical protein
MKYRKPTEKETATLDRSRELMQRGIQEEKGLMARLMPTMGKAARDDMRKAKDMRESVPSSVRDYEAYKDSEMKKGGMVKKYAMGGKVSSASKRADGCAVKGKTKGRMV